MNATIVRLLPADEQTLLKCYVEGAILRRKSNFDRRRGNRKFMG
jgi:hypothetical protein